MRRQPEPGFARVDPLRGRVSQGLLERNQRESTMSARGRSQALRVSIETGQLQVAPGDTPRTPKDSYGHFGAPYCPSFGPETSRSRFVVHVPRRREIPSQIGRAQPTGFATLQHRTGRSTCGPLAETWLRPQFSEGSRDLRAGKVIELERLLPDSDVVGPGHVSPVDVN